MEHKLIHSQSQQLILSPQLRQYLKLLQLPLLDLQVKIEEELTQNPVLEEAGAEASEKNSDEKAEDSRLKELEFDKTIDQINSLDDDMRENLFHYSDFSDEPVSDQIKKRNYQETLLTSSPTLASFLEWQLNLFNLTELERKIAEEIIGDIDDDGYLAATVEEIAQTTQSSVQQVEKILSIIQSLDPPGVGGRTLSEVLLIQLKRSSEDPIAQKIVEFHLPLLQRRQTDALAAQLGTTPEKISSSVQAIAKLEPKPGRIFYQKNSMTVVPDVTISRGDDENGNPKYAIDINQESIPELRINHKYRQMLKDKKLDAKTKAFLREKIQNAILFVRALSERKSTLRQIAEKLVDIQLEFLNHGFSHLKPLRLKDVADKLGIHESTISRAISGKYVHCPQGTIPLKSFFSNSMTTDGGTLESQKSVMEKVRALVQTEDKKKPLSDSKIAILLKSEGIDIARRTVAKYRDLLRILPTHLRKVK